MLQTAASIENLAVATYDTALTLDFIGGASANRGGQGVRRRRRKDQHQEHAEAFNAAATRLGGKAQDQPDPVLLGVVNNAKPTLTGPGGGRRPRASSSRTAPRRPTSPTSVRTPNKNARAVAASIMGVEAQHVAILNAVKALVAGGAADLIALPPDAAKLPAAAGSVGFPDAFFKTDECPSRRTKEQCSERVATATRLAISEAELVAMTARPRRRAPRVAALDARQPRPSGSESDDDVRAGSPDLVSTPASRRAFLLGGGAVLGGVALVGSGDGQRVSPPPRPEVVACGVPSATSAQKLSGDLAVVALAASLENLAVGTYQAGIDAATAGQARRGAAGSGDVRHDRAEPAQGPRRGVERRAHRRGQEGGHRRRH